MTLKPKLQNANLTLTPVGRVGPRIDTFVTKAGVRGSNLETDVYLKIDCLTVTLTVTTKLLTLTLNLTLAMNLTLTLPEQEAVLKAAAQAPAQIREWAGATLSLDADPRR